MSMPMTIEIREERPDSPDAAELVNELHAHLSSGYPPESCHGYSVAKLISESEPISQLVT